tara:strand:+ start:1048 stop:1245 length:198 start_codon:yes stop_codon:yes gene_type:complete
MQTELEAYNHLQELLSTAMVAACEADNRYGFTSPLVGLVFNDVGGQLLDMLADLDPTVRQLEDDK